MDKILEESMLEIRSKGQIFGINLMMIILVMAAGVFAIAFYIFISIWLASISYSNMVQTVGFSYIIFIMVSTSIGMASYLLSYPFLGLPAFFLQLALYKCRLFAKQANEMKILCGESSPSIRVCKNRLFFSITYYSDRSGVDISNLFYQLMFARSSLFAALIAYIKLEIDHKFFEHYSVFLIICLWLIAIISYTFGCFLFDRSMIDAANIRDGIIKNSTSIGK